MTKILIWILTKTMKSQGKHSGSQDSARTAARKWTEGLAMADINKVPLCKECKWFTPLPGSKKTGFVTKVKSVKES
jgi:hypothetical protein